MRFVLWRSVLLAVFGLECLSLIGCNQPSAPAAPAAMPPMPVAYIVAKPVDIPKTIEAVAQTEAAKLVEIRPRVGGILLKKRYQEGEMVKAGQVLFELDPEPLKAELAQAKAQLAQQQARITQANREAARLKPLLDSQAISQREYDNATSDASIAQAGVAQAQAAIKSIQLNLSYTQVTSPVAGLAGRFQLSEGALLSAGSSLLTTVSQIQPIWARFSLTETDLQRLDQAALNTSKIQLLLADGSVFAEVGKLNFSANEINPNLGSLELRAEFANQNKQLLPGQFVRARISAGVQQGVFLLPQALVQTNEQGKFVMLINAQKTVEARPIKVAGMHENQWVITEGLQESDQIAADNLIKLRPGAPVAPYLQGTKPPLPNMGDKPAH